MLQVSKDEHYSKKCPNLLALPKENVNSYTWKFFIKEKSKVQVLIFLPNNQILVALMRKINEILMLMEQKLVRDVILKKSVFEICGSIFVLIKDHLAKKVYWRMPTHFSLCFKNIIWWNLEKGSWNVKITI